MSAVLTARSHLGPFFALLREMRKNLHPAKATAFTIQGARQPLDIVYLKWGCLWQPSTLQLRDRFCRRGNFEEWNHEWSDTFPRFHAPSDRKVTSKETSFVHGYSDYRLTGSDWAESGDSQKKNLPQQQEVTKKLSFTKLREACEEKSEASWKTEHRTTSPWGSMKRLDDFSVPRCTCVRHVRSTEDPPILISVGSGKPDLSLSTEWTLECTYQTWQNRPPLGVTSDLLCPFMQDFISSHSYTRYPRWVRIALQNSLTLLSQRRTFSSNLWFSW